MSRSEAEALSLLGSESSEMTLLIIVNGPINNPDLMHVVKVTLKSVFDLCKVF